MWPMPLLSKELPSAGLLARFLNGIRLLTKLSALQILRSFSAQLVTSTLTHLLMLLQALTAPTLLTSSGLAFPPTTWALNRVDSSTHLIQVVDIPHILLSTLLVLAFQKHSTTTSWMPLTNWLSVLTQALFARTSLVVSADFNSHVTITKICSRLVKTSHNSELISREIKMARLFTFLLPTLFQHH